MRHLFVMSLIVLASCSNTQQLKNIEGGESKVTCQPIYGNWCGKGYPAYEVTGFKPRPVDVWDAACKQHDLCYEKYGERGEARCDMKFSSQLERLDSRGVPAPHELINAYNYFKESKPYRQFNITLGDVWDANTMSCRGDEGRPTLFCDVGRGRNNCEISIGRINENGPCFCDYPNLWGPFGRMIPGGRFFGQQKRADEFL